MTEETINGYSIDLLARALLDRSLPQPCSDREWSDHAREYPSHHALLMQQARREAKR